MIKPILKEQADINRILRGYGKKEDLDKVSSIQKLKQTYPKYTKNIFGVELEMLQQTLLNRISIHE